MRDRWSPAEAARALERWGPRWGEALALRTYASRLLGAEPALVIAGGGNTSVKVSEPDCFGAARAVLRVKASGRDLATIEPDGHVAVELEHLRRLRALDTLDDATLLAELRRARLDPDAPDPSIEAAMHAWCPGRYVDHTHAEAVLVLSNRDGGEALLAEALGEAVLVIPYAAPGAALARLAAAALEARPAAQGMVWMHHGVLTWGESARESYRRMIELVGRAEAYLAARARRGASITVPAAGPPPAAIAARLAAAAPLVRGALATASGDPDRPHRRVVLRALAGREVLALLEGAEGRERACSAPLTEDHLIRIGRRPAWVESPALDDPPRLRAQLDEALAEWATGERERLERHAAASGIGPWQAEPRPRVVVLAGAGALCAGRDPREAGLAAEVLARNLAAKAQIAASGGRYRSIEEAELVAVQYRPQQRAKLGAGPAGALAATVALVTGAAGAIGAGICERLLEEGALVAAADLPGERLEGLVAELDGRHPGRVLAVAMDVGDPAAVAAGFDQAALAWGGVDLVVINAGLAHVAGLAELELEAFRRLERVNTEGTLLLLAEAARHLERQGTGGDVVLVSTKNVFAPGARFGAYSATKAAAHQLARVASQELAALDVRVNMVAPDAVFAHGERRSGLWQEVGPDRMRARGLDEAELERYYRERNLLKAQVSARHVANAVLFFATRQTPTTGATLPVDGGLPDATPR